MLNPESNQYVYLWHKQSWLSTASFFLLTSVHCSWEKIVQFFSIACSMFLFFFQNSLFCRLVTNKGKRSQCSLLFEDSQPGEKIDSCFSLGMYEVNINYFSSWIPFSVKITVMPPGTSTISIFLLILRQSHRMFC